MQEQNAHEGLRRDDMRAVIYFAVALATEAGPTPQRLTVPSRGGYGGAPIGAGGYTLGVLQFDFGHHGVEPMEPGKSYAQALGEEINGWASAVKRPRLSMPVGLARGELDFVRILLSNRRSGGLLWLPRPDWDLVRAWGDSDRGRQWIWRHIELRQIEGLVGKVIDAMTLPAVSTWKREELIQFTAILAKAWHRRASVYQSLVAFLTDRPDATFAEFERRVAVEEVNSPLAQLSRAADAARLVSAIEQSRGIRGLMARAIERMGSADFGVIGFREDPALRMLQAIFKDSGHGGRAIDRFDGAAVAGDHRLAWQVGDGLGDFDALVFDDANRELHLRTVSVEVTLASGEVIERDSRGQTLRRVDLSEHAARVKRVGTTEVRAAEATRTPSPETAPRWIPPKGARIFRLPNPVARHSASEGPIIGESGGHWIQQTGADVYLAIPKSQVPHAIQPGATPLRLVFHDGRVAEVSEIAPAVANEKSLPAMAG